MKKLLFIILSVTFTSFTSYAGSFVLNEYNLVTIEDFVSNGHIQGKSFVGGDLSGSTATFGQSINGETSLTVVGEIASGTSIKAENNHVVVSELNADASGTYDGQSIGNASSVVVGSTASLEIIKEDYKTQLESASASFAALDTNSYLSNNNLTIDDDITAGDYAVFSIDGNTSIFDGSNSGGLGIQTSTAGMSNEEVLSNLAGIIINVSGDNLELYTNIIGNFSNSIFAEKIIWNFYEATEINLEQTLYGTLLAPLATVSTTKNIDGAVGVSSLIFSQAGEIHMPLSTVTPPVTTTVEVPEPTPLLLISMGIIGLLVKRRSLNI